MRHSRDIVQACPGGGPVIPNQSLAEQRLERKIRTQEFRFFSSSAFFFFQWMLNSKLYFISPHTHTHTHSSCSFCLASHQLSFHFIHHYLHIILIISTLSLVSADGFVRLCVSRRHFWVQTGLDRQRTRARVEMWSVCVCVCVCVCTLSLFLLLCWAICNTSQMNTDLFNCINSSLWPGLRSSRGKKMILWG